MTGVEWALLVVGVVVVALMVLWCVSRARRLDRLHVRLDAARSGLAAALNRRAGVASQVLGEDVAGPRCRQSHPHAATCRAGGVADLATREAAESALTGRLASVQRAGLDTALLVELVDAEQLVILARRVHNDAVRDTRALRSRRLVRWLRLAGTAPEPTYFDIAEPEPSHPERPAPAQPRPGRVTREAPAGPASSRTIG